jgi:hypothetical protein
VETLTGAGPARPENEPVTRHLRVDTPEPLRSTEVPVED